jgi:hypothetical protein
MIFSYPQFTIDIDVDKTQTYYDSAPLVSENCVCSGCRNYEMAVDSLPKPVKSFFSRLGVDMKKICEAYVNCTNADDTVFYGGFYHVCGKLVSGDSTEEFPLTDEFSVSLREECDLLDEDFPLPAIQLEISADIPWVLDEANTYEKDK